MKYINTKSYNQIKIFDFIIQQKPTKHLTNKGDANKNHKLDNFDTQNYSQSAKKEEKLIVQASTKQNSISQEINKHSASLLPSSSSHQKPHQNQEENFLEEVGNEEIQVEEDDGDLTSSEFVVKIVATFKVANYSKLFYVLSTDEISFLQQMISRDTLFHGKKLLLLNEEGQKLPLTRFFKEFSHFDANKNEHFLNVLLRVE